MKELKVNFASALGRLEIGTKKHLFGGLSGEYKSVFKGAGLEFTGYRKYDMRDDATRIDWRASLRTHDLLVRELEEERNLEIVFAVDVSSTMAFASVEKLKNEYAAEMVAALSFAILQTGDSVGLVMFTDRIIRYIPPNTGRKQYYLITKSLGDPALYDGPFDLERGLVLIGNTIRRNTILILVSDFIGLKGDWKGAVKIASQRHELIGLMVRDPRDNFLPSIGLVAVSDPFSGKELLFDTGEMKPEYEATAREQVETVKAVFKDARSDFAQFFTDRPFESDVLKFFKERKARWK